MNNLNFKIIGPHLIAILIFYVLTAAYFSPLVFDKKAIKQSDVSQYKGMSHEIELHRKQYGEEPLWTNSMFGGMPSYQISTQYPGNLIPYIDKVFKGLFLPQPAFYYFSCMLGFYFLMLVLEIDVWLG